jgi:hypothetical protein
MARTRGEETSMKLLVQGSIAALTLALLAGFTGYGTFAAFSAQTTNPSNVLSTGTMLMTNVAGTVVSGSDCSTATASGTCATLFNASTTAMAPGGVDKTNTVTITYLGSITTASFGFYLSNFNTKGAGSLAGCTATDPATKINLQIKQGTLIIYPTGGSGYGTLAAFAAAYSSVGTMLHLKNGANGGGTLDVWSLNDSAVFTINVNVDTSADNTYQGCQSLADLVWYAA